MKTRIEQSIIWCLVLILGTMALAQPVIKSPAAILIEGNNGGIIWEKKSDEKRHVASITKILTMILVIEAVENNQFSLDDLVSVSESAKRQGGSQIWLEIGEQMSVKDLLYSLSVGSANDSAVALAEFHSGSELAFVEKMNEKAKEIGCTNTHFVNCNGLPENSHRVLEGQHYSTAKDIALVTFYAYKLPLFADLVSTYEYTVRPGQKGEVVLYNYNKLFLRGYPGADGVKTGMVEASGYCLSASAIREDLRLIAVVLGASSNQERYKDIVSILDYGYNNFKGILLASKSDVIMEIPVHHGKKEKIEIYAQDDLRVTLKKGVDTLPTIDLEIKEYLKAPVKKGECVGVIKAKLGEEIVGEMQAIAGEDVEKATIWLEISRSFLKILGIVKG
ncbi:MAG TPA: D-alanyl-D-alanine carboxypeptidase [Firmicutes bacterium]|nr:D-alanyl-D-alanine carboxypeptidase [Bacillota bacterium]